MPVEFYRKKRNNKFPVMENINTEETKYNNIIIYKLDKIIKLLEQVFS